MLTYKSTSSFTSKNTEMTERFLGGQQEEVEDINNKISFRLRDVNIKIPRGQMVFIIGRVGSGKSSLLYSLLGEMKVTPPDVIATMTGNFDSVTPKLTRHGSVAFLSQRPWLMPKTIQENILIGKDLDSERLIRCVDMAQFEQDMALMPEGFETMIGEDGQTLSGGQRTRLALSRCIYQE